MAIPNFHDQIPDYFAGDLSQGERQAFEQALEEDTSLKDAVTIWQEMEEVLAPAPEDQLVANITRLRLASSTAPPTKSWSWKWGIPAVLLIGALSWYFWPGNEILDPVIEAIPAEEIDSLETPVDTLEIAPGDSLPAESIAPPTTPDPPFRRPVPPPPEKEEEEAPQPPVFAANYDPNPLIEAEMTEQLRGGEVELEMIHPAPDEEVKSVDGAINLAFSGTLMTDLAEDEFTIRLLILSNAVEDYQQSNFIAAFPGTLTPEEGGYSFAFNAATNAAPGLYYYFIEWEEEETYLKIGRLRVE